MVRENIIDAIGKTPLVRLRLGEGARAPVFAKMELLNPMGMKDRVAKQVILEAKRTGLLKDGAPIIESSSGTMALGLALVGTYLGHEVHIVTDARTDPMTLAKLRALGCTLEVVTQMTHLGWQSARLDRLAELLAANPDAFCPRQYENPDNPLAYEALAEELMEDLGNVDILVGSVGSGGSLCGSARALKRMNKNVRVVAVDAVGSVIFDQPDVPNRLQGGHGNSVVPRNVDLRVIDEIHWLSDDECFAATLELAKHEKIFAGNSSGAVYGVARWLSSRVAPETKIVAILPDRGDRYFHSVYNEEFRRQKGVNSGELKTEPKLVPYGTPVKIWSYALSPASPEARHRAG
ncbi:cysteine synthase family protein [Archangium sp.]|uniref:cysteine synthase family protein n=1 Tax=Archangium sp. TaxID=1872627 RepID=UPI00286BB65A|nr:cysteine synthase family protein [Archangium sp.]